MFIAAVWLQVRAANSYQPIATTTEANAVFPN